MNSVEEYQKDKTNNSEYKNNQNDNNLNVKTVIDSVKKLQNDLQYYKKLDIINKSNNEKHIA
jgi:hypothetical protein